MVALRRGKLFVAPGCWFYLPVDSGEVHAHAAAWLWRFACAGQMSVAGDAAPGDSELHAPAIIHIGRFIQRAAQVHSVFQSLYFPIMQDIRVIEAVWARDE